MAINTSKDRSSVRRPRDDLALGVSRSTVTRWHRQVQQFHGNLAALSPTVTSAAGAISEFDQENHEI
jgi:transposase-like protein